MSTAITWEVPTLYCTKDAREGCIVEVAEIIKSMPHELYLLMNCGHLVFGRMLTDFAFYLETAHGGYMPLIPGTTVTYREEGVLSGVVSYGGHPKPAVSLFTYLRKLIDRYTVPAAFGLPTHATYDMYEASAHKALLHGMPAWMRRAVDAGTVTLEGHFNPRANRSIKYTPLLRMAISDAATGDPCIVRLAPGSIVYHTERGLAWTTACHRLTTHGFAGKGADVPVWMRAAVANFVSLRDGRPVVSGTDITLVEGDHIGYIAIPDAEVYAYLPGYVDPPQLQIELGAGDLSLPAGHVPHWVSEAAAALNGAMPEAGSVLCQHRNSVSLTGPDAPVSTTPVELNAQATSTPVTGTLSVDGKLQLSLSAKALIGLMQQDGGGVAIRQSIIQEVMGRYVKGFMPEHVDRMVEASVKSTCDKLMAEGRSILRTVYNGFEASFTLTPGATPAFAPEYVRLTDRGTQQVRLAVEKRLDEVMTEHVQKLVDEHIRSAATEGVIRNMVATVIADSFDIEVKAAIRARMTAAIQNALDDMPNVALRVYSEDKDA